MRTKRIILVLVFAAGLLSCKRQDASLDRISSFIRTEPERALYELEEYRDSLPAREFNRAYYALLYSEALDRCYIDNANDSIIRPAAEYFGRKGPDSLSVKSWFYLGLVQKNAKDYAGAIFSLSKAIKAATAVQDYHYRGLAYRTVSQIYGGTFSDINDANYMSKAIEDFDLARSEYHADYSRLLLASTYIDLKDFEKCDSLLNLLIDKYQEDSIFLSNAYRFKVISKILSEDYNPWEVIGLFKKAQNYSYFSFEIPQLALMAGPFEQIKESYSADSIINRAYSLCTTAADTAMVDYENYKLLKKRKLYDEAVLKLEKTYFTQDSLVYSYLNNSLDYSLNELNQHEHALEAAKEDRRKLLYLSAITISFLVVMLLSIAIQILFRKIKERNQRIQQYLLQIKAAKEKVSAYESDLKMLNDDLQAAMDKNRAANNIIFEQINKRVEIIQTLLRQYDSLTVRESKTQSYFDKYEALENIIREHHNVMEDMRFEPVLLDGLEQAVNISMDNIMARVRAYYSGKVKEEDYRILVCTLAGLRPKATGFVTGVSDGTVRTKKSRWLDKIEKISDSELRELLNANLA